MCVFQTVLNLALTPVDIALIPFFMFVGGWIFKDSAAQNFSVDTFMKEMAVSTFDTLIKFQASLIYGILAWFICLPILAVTLYAICYPIFKRILPAVKEQ